MGITRYFDPKLSEELRLRSGILRKEVLARSLDFRCQFYEWQQKSSLTALKELRQHYETTFFDDNEHCQVFRRQQSARVCFNQLALTKPGELAFVLDELKIRSQAAGFTCFRAESWKLLRAEDGVAQHQRYLLHYCKPGLLNKLFSRWIDSELLVLESISSDKQKSQLEIRLYPAKNKQVAAQGIDRLMGTLLQQTNI